MLKLGPQHHRSNKQQRLYAFCRGSNFCANGLSTRLDYAFAHDTVAICTHTYPPLPRCVITRKAAQKRTACWGLSILALYWSLGCANCSPPSRECSYFNSPCFVVSCSFQIRVVNAFRQGLDARYGEHSNTSLAEVLRKQTSLSKRLSQTSSIEYADNIPDELTIPEIDVERLSSHSHTETAV